MSFGTLGLCDELLKTVAEQGYTTPSPIQMEAIPAVLSGRDVMAIARTGTGKTAGFTLPMLQLLSAGSAAEPSQVRALVIAPTRELAAQVAGNVQTYSRHLTLRAAVVYGGVNIEEQIAKLQTGLDVLVATPGRLLDLYDRGAINFDTLEILVLDEADRMLDLGFIDAIRRIQSLLPPQRQTLMFSATLSKAIKALVKGMLNNPQVIETSAANSTGDSIKQTLHPVDKARKTEALIHLIKQHNWQQVLVFTRTRRGADELSQQLIDAGISAESIHSNRSQHARTAALAGFSNGEIAVLVATDIAARGLDVSQLPYVINVDLPYVPEDYVHRIGRTGRAGTTGLAVSLVSLDEAKQLQSIERLIGRQFKREIIPGFEPTEKPPEKSPQVLPDDEWGNFEADEKPAKRRGRGRGRARERAKGRPRARK